MLNSMAVKSIFSFFGGTGHDGNLSIFLEGKIHTVEFERIFGNRFFCRQHNPFSFYSLDIEQTFFPGKEEDTINLLNYIKEILVSRGVFSDHYEVGLFDWDTPEKIVEIVSRFFSIQEVCYKDDVTSHHKAHAASAFYSSGFDKAMVFSYDGGGNDGNFCVYDIEKSNPSFKQINKRDEVPYSTKYARLANFTKEIKKPTPRDYLDSQRHEHNGVSYPGKLMGLAAYGSFNQNFYNKISAYLKDEETQNFSPSFLDNFENYQYDQFEGPLSYDFAFNSQLVFEETFLERFHQFFDKNKHKNVCLTGGGALNVVLNERLSKTYPETNFFIPSSPGDSGISYGMITHYMNGPVVPEVMYSGCGILDKGSLPYILDHRAWKKATPELIATELEKGKIIGICRGDSETGPRALGNRSILADPRSHKSKDAINSKVKFREWFRPFAPICKEDKASTFFETSDNACYKYMSFSPPVREKYKKVLPAVTHVDGSARLQTISKKDNEFIYNTLDEFEKITNIPILVNTSFNSRGKAILTRYLTAIQILDSTELDAVVLEDYYIYK